MTLSPHEILGPDGRIAKRLPNYEHRQQQLQMAAAVYQALRQGHHLVADSSASASKPGGACTTPSC